jgi:hypothetical protein
MTTAHTLISGVGAAIGCDYVPSSQRIVFVEFYGSVAAFDVAAGSYAVLGRNYSNPEDIVVEPAGTALVSERAGTVVRVDLANADRGQATEVVPGSFGLREPQQLALRPDGQRAWVVEYTYGGQPGRLLELDLASTPAGVTIKLADLDRAVGLAVTADGSTAYVSEQTGTGRIRRVDLTTGTTSVVAQGLPAPFFLRWADAAQAALLVALRDPVNQVRRLDLSATPPATSLVLSVLPWRASSVLTLPDGRLVVCSDRSVTAYDPAADEPVSATPRGLGGGGAMYQPKVSPSGTRRMFVACDMGGLYRSQDGGASWQMRDERQVQGSARFSTAFDPAAPDHLVGYHAVRGLMESVDGGGAWTPYSPALPAGAVVTAAAFSSASELFVGTRTGLYRRSGGAWAQVVSGVDEPVTDLAGKQLEQVNSADVLKIVFVRHPVSGDELCFVATVRGIWTCDLAGGGNTWTPFNTGLPLVADPGPAVSYFYDHDPPNPSLPRLYVASPVRGLAGGSRPGSYYVLYAAVAGQRASAYDPTMPFSGGVYRCLVDSATTTPQWQPAMGTGTRRLNQTTFGGPVGDFTGTPIARYEHLAVAEQQAAATPPDPDTVYISVINSTFTPNVYKTANRGDDWDGVYAGFQKGVYNVEGGWLDLEPLATAQPPGTYGGLGWGFGGAAKGLCAAPTDPNTAAFTNNGVLHLTQDGGQGAVPPQRDWSSRYTRRVPQATPGVVRWQTVGLDVTTNWSYYIDPADPYLHFIACTDIGLARSEDLGETWASVSQAARGAGLSQLDSWRNFYELVFAAGAMFAAVSTQHDLPYPKELGNLRVGAVLRSDTQGQTWYRVGNVSPNNRPVVSLVYGGPSGQEALYASVWREGVFRSSDLGATWTPEFSLPGSLNRAYRLQFDDTGVLYCLMSGPGSGSGLYRRDPTAGWSDLTVALRNSIGANGFYPMDYAVRPVTPDAIWLCTTAVGGVADGAVYKGTPSGVGWQWTGQLGIAQMPPGSQSFFHGFAPFFDPRDPTGATVYATTTTHGTWRTSDAGATWAEVGILPFISTQRICFDDRQPGTGYITTLGGGSWKVDL